MAATGVAVTVVGWVPYLVGCALIHGANIETTAANTVLAAAAGGAGALIYSHLRYRKPDTGLIFSGVLGGLVAISAAAGQVDSGAAVLIGAVAGVLVSIATIALDLRWQIDDPAGGISVHAIGGAWGVLATGLLLPGTIADRIRQLGAQAAGAGAICTLAMVASVVVFIALKATLGLRLREDEEFDGVDLVEHDLNAYPDFQQTTIKSYHLREA
jgi:Amt family ammonium transporter